MPTDAVHDFLMRQASGTSTNPAAEPMHMEMFHYGDWMLMAHGMGFMNQVWQSGPHGGDELFSTNWAMGMASRPLGAGHLMLRSMLSLEPLTVRGKSYPELFQTGETANGRPLRDAQHPHDFFMELAAEYALEVAPGTIGYVYLAPMGDPSLGPVAYPHRASAMELPQATLAHHVEDSTHIAANVITAGARRGMFGGAFSVFHGGEPDEDRWDIESGSIDSWAIRLTADPSPNWTMQVSTGHLKKPEALEPGDLQRTTASLAYSTSTAIGRWSSSLIFGRNDKEVGGATNAWTAESMIQFLENNYLTVRGEIVDKDELFAGEESNPLHDRTFQIRALTLGYSRDLVALGGIGTGAGATVTIYDAPGELEPFYGSNPRAVHIFVRFRYPAGSAHRM